MAAAADPAIALRAIGLMGQWMRLARGHIGVTACIACTCTASFADILIADLESDLLEYLRERHRAAPALRALLAGEAAQQEPGALLGSLLRTIAEGRADAPAGELAALLADIDRWMDGIAKLAR